MNKGDTVFKVLPNRLRIDTVCWDCGIEFASVFEDGRIPDMVCPECDAWHVLAALPRGASAQWSEIPRGGVAAVHRMAKVGGQP